MEVSVHGGNLDTALRTLKRLLFSDGIFKRIKDREDRIKPSVRRRAKHQAALRLLKKKEKKAIHYKHN